MKKITGALIGMTLMFGVVGCATQPVEPAGPTAEELAEQRRQAELAERLAREEAEQLAREKAAAERLAAEEAARRAEAERRARDLELYGAPGSAKEFRARAGERVFFDVDQWRLDNEDKAVLSRQANWLQANPNVRVLVAGNCDERGTREYNIALGERRAAVVRDYLVSLGVNASRIEVTSNGKDRPWVEGSGPAVWSQNRNGHTQLVSGYTSES